MRSAGNLHRARPVPLYTTPLPSPIQSVTARFIYCILQHFPTSHTDQTNRKTCQQQIFNYIPHKNTGSLRYLSVVKEVQFCIAYTVRILRPIPPQIGKIQYILSNSARV